MGMLRFQSFHTNLCFVSRTSCFQSSTQLTKLQSSQLALQSSTQRFPSSTQLSKLPSSQPQIKTFDPLYMQRHQWVRAWGERKAPATPLPTAQKGKAPRKVNVPKIDLELPEFKGRKKCELHRRMKGKRCVAMSLQDVTGDSDLICRGV